MKRRVMLKLSGEALSGDIGFGFNNDTTNSIISDIKEALKSDIELAIIVGGGNFMRGKALSNIDKYKADQIGMLSTYMNGIYLSSMFNNAGIDNYLCGSVELPGVVDVFNKDRCIDAFNQNKVVIISGGTGHPYFTTDTGVVLRALELDCKEALLGKNIDGVYDKDPKTYSDAKKYDKLTFKEMTDKQLKVIDLTASSLCLDTNLVLRIFLLNAQNSIIKAIKGEDIGTLITN